MSTIQRAAVALVFGSVIFIGLPLLGWGLTDARAFFDHPARLGYVVLILLLQVAVVITRPTSSSPRGSGSQPASRLDLVLIQVFSLAVVIAAPYSDGHDVAALGAGDWLRWVGLAALGVGFGGMQWAEATLGRQFSVEVTLQTDHQLITSGPYRYVRHPRYLGIMLFMAGIALVFASWLGLLVVAALVSVLLWRVRAEEAMMRAAFGAAWEQYARRSWRVIPFVY